MDKIDLKSETVLVVLVKALRFFVDSDEATRQCFDRLKTALHDKLTGDKVYWLVDVFKKEADTFKNYIPLIEIFTQGKNTLQERIDRNLSSVSSWCMPDAKLSGHPLVEEFLRSDQEEMIYNWPFNSKKHVDKFIEKINDTKWTSSSIEFGFSAQLTRLENGAMLIKKTKTLYEGKIRKNSDYQADIQRIDEFLKLIN